MAAVRALVSRHGEPGEARGLPWSLDDEIAVVLEERVPVFSYRSGSSTRSRSTTSASP